ncbi:putative oxidoreductase [Pseudolycoriella hygida]|uniref:Oxidoreductase n=1 Tax=Pseudolycoriella hygida TaxID=35572 RepID=A0A9Q0MPV3_9DIPT|nr:putative oxidoreductase [Pseudolycoriella hygida]
MSFDDKVILITGAGSGIGADASRHLAKLGGKIVLVDLNEPNLLQVEDEIKKSGYAAPLVIVADVTTDCERIISETIEHFGKLNVLVNNAGIVNYDTVNNVHLPEFDRVFDINVKSVVKLTQLAVPHLQKTKGNVVNISSVAALQSEPNLLSYSMSKAAINQFTKCTALDLAPFGIRVNSVNPSAIRTPIFEKVGLTAEQVDNFFEKIKSNYPVGRVGEVSDTSAGIAYLASDSASFLTGVLLPVDGGALLGGCTLNSNK